MLALNPRVTAALFFGSAILSSQVPVSHASQGPRPGTFTDTNVCVAFQEQLADGSILFNGAQVVFPERVRWRWVGSPGPFGGPAYLGLPGQESRLVAWVYPPWPILGGCYFPL